METDLHPLLQVNVMFTYAHDISLLVPAHIDVSLAVEFLHIKTWADSNGLVINLGKTKQQVLHHPHPNKH